jgi:hypothetical protein
VRIPPNKLSLIRSKIADAVGAAKETSAINRRTLASLVGLLSFFSRAVPASRAYLRRLYSCIHDVGKEQGAHDYDVDISLPPEAKMDLLWWSEAVLRFRDAQVLRGIGAKVLRQHSDASGDGWECTSEEYGSGVVAYNCGLFTPELSARTSNYTASSSRFTRGSVGRGSCTPAASNSTWSPTPTNPSLQRASTLGPPSLRSFCRW